MNYTIGEFSMHTNLSVHTLRYYEKEKLITPERKSNNRRVYSENDVAWIQFVKRLKDTGMPIKEIKKYANYRSAGDSTINERIEMLTEHRIRLKQQFDDLQEHLNKLDVKIKYYQDEVNGL